MIRAQAGGGMGFILSLQETQGKIPMHIINLDPDTVYDVYCYSEDFDSRVMDIDDSTDHKISDVTTDCCRTISFTSTVATQVKYIKDSLIPEIPFKIQLDSRPTGYSVATISYTEVSCDQYQIPVINPRARVSISPNNFTFDETSSFLEGSFLVRSFDQVCLILDVESVGPDYYQPSKANLTVTGYNVPPLPPIVTSVQMADNGRSLRVKFDKDTDKGLNRIPGYSAAFSCEFLFDMKAANDSLCKWPRDDEVTIQFSDKFFAEKPEVGDDIFIKEEKVTNPCVAPMDCSRLQYVANQTIEIEYPKNALVPEAFVSTSSRIGSCDVIDIDPTGSVGNAGRPWKTVSWAVTTKNVVNLDEDGILPVIWADEILAELEKNYDDGDIGMNAIIGSEFLQAGGTYSFSLTLTNFLDQTALHSAVVEVSESSAIPRVKLEGVSNAVKYRWQQLNFFASASVPKCAGSDSRIALQYDWKIYKDVELQNGIVSTSGDNRYFRVAEYIFDSLTTYTVQVVVTIPKEGIPVSSTASLTIQIGESGLVAQIESGSAQSVSLAYPFSLDASASYDVDYPDDSSRLSYKWNCVEVSPKFGGVCPGFDDPLFRKTLPNLNVPGDSLIAESSYNFSVVVEATGSAAASTAYTVVSVKGRTIPRVSMINSAAKYNPASKVVVSGIITADPEVSGDEGVTAYWEAVDGTIEIEAIALTPVAWDPYVPDSASYVARFELTVAPNTLVAGLKYQFMLSAKYENDPKSTSTAFVEVNMNEPPRGGNLVITSDVTGLSSGIAMNETFTFRSSKWADDFDDLPLQYSFSYYAPATESKQTIFRGKSVVSHASGVLSGGPDLSTTTIEQYTQTGIASAFDIYGASNEAEANVIVDPGVLDADDLNDILEQQLANAGVSNDASQAAATVAAILARLNAVDCSSPTDTFFPVGHSDEIPNFCDSSFNRYPCSTTASTCGACKAGYRGLPGDSNSACRKIDARRRLSEEATTKYRKSSAFTQVQSASTSVALSLAGSECSDEGDCASSICTDNVCIEAYKTCPGPFGLACAGESSGTCVAFNTNKGEVVDKCLVYDPYCVTQCHCELGKCGADCTLESAD